MYYATQKIARAIFANKIVVHQYTDIQNIPFVPDQKQKEFAFNKKNLYMKGGKI